MLPMRYLLENKTKYALTERNYQRRIHSGKTSTVSCCSLPVVAACWNNEMCIN